jgi:hypothetical protein
MRANPEVVEKLRRRQAEIGEELAKIAARLALFDAA